MKNTEDMTRSEKEVHVETIKREIKTIKREIKTLKAQINGDKLKYGEPTTTIAFRLPESKVDLIKEVIENELKKYRV